MTYHASLLPLGAPVGGWEDVEANFHPHHPQHTGSRIAAAWSQNFSFNSCCVGRVIVFISGLTLPPIGWFFALRLRKLCIVLCTGMVVITTSFEVCLNCLSFCCCVARGEGDPVRPIHDSLRPDDEDDA